MEKEDIKVRRFLLCAVLVFSLSVLATAQQAPKADLFGGFSYLHFDTKGAAGLEANHYGWNGAVNLNANRWLGIKADLSGHYKELAPGTSFNSFSALFGPQLTHRAEKASPFVHALFGVNRTNTGGSSDSAFATALGGGLDLNVAKNVAFRLIQADYFMTRHSAQTQNNVRLGTGLVFNLGGGPPPAPLAATCSINPTSVMAGEPVTMTTTAANIPKNHTVEYKFTSTGGNLTPKDNTAAVATTGLAPGQYTVNATATDPKAKKTPPATCNAAFTIQEPPKHPPTITCSANPATVQAGQPSTITATGQSPDNRPLTYNFTTTVGRITPSGATATLDTAGAPAGSITVNCTATDDRGLSASSNTGVNVEVPPPPPQASKLNEIQFKNAKKPARVDNEAKAILDDVALRLQREPESKAVVIGNFDPNEKKGQSIAQQRAVNTKAYLTEEKGIDPARIEVRTGNAGLQTAEIWIVPPGATFTQGETFDASKLKVGKDAYPHPKPAPKPRVKKVSKPAPASKQ